VVGIVFVISGPAGVGKTTLCERLIGEFSETVKRVVTVTTRKPRAGEESGRDYHFLGREEFLKKVDQGAFIEYECIHDNYYGTLKETILSEIESPDGGDLLLNIDVNGASSLKEFAKTNKSLQGIVICVFVNPASITQLKERLLKRGSDDIAEIEKRLKAACVEIEKKGQFDFILSSEGREEDYEKLMKFYRQCSPLHRSDP
jgi:guanylate kinase